MIVCKVLLVTSGGRAQGFSAGDQLMCQRTLPTHREALGAQRGCQRTLPATQRGLDQRQVEQIALRVAATETMGDFAQRADQAYGFVVA